MKNATPTALGLAISLALTGFALEPASAQNQVLQIEEIVVTARKKEENLQEIPISVSAFNDELIESLNMLTPQDVANFTPGFSYNQGFGRHQGSRPVIRGQSNILGVPNASFFIDGAFVSGAIQAVELDNLERIEVIKGPQAALYGRATFSGAINYITKAPAEELEVNAKLRVAEHAEKEAQFSVSGPLGDSAGYYVAVHHYEYGGEYKNLFDGKTVGDEETQSLSAKLTFAPNDNFDGSFRVTFSQDDDGLFPLILQGRDQNNCFQNGPTAPRARGYFCGTVENPGFVNLRTDVFDDPGTERDAIQGSLNLNFSFANGMTLSSVTGYNSEEIDSQLDVSYGAYDPFVQFFDFGSFFRVLEEENSDFSQELRLSSPQDQRFRWLAGIYYYKNETDQLRDDKRVPPEAPPFLMPGTQQPNDELDFGEIENKAIFAAVEYDFTDRLTGTAELRAAEDKITAVGTDSDRVVTTGPFENTFESVTPRFTLTYLVNDDLTLYGNLARGNKPGGFNLGTLPNPAFRTYKEEEADNLELGFKSTIADGRMRLNGNLFFIDWTEQQLTNTIFTPSGGTVRATSLIQNVGETSVKGLELEMSALVTDNWTLDLTYAYIDSEIDAYISQDQADLIGGDGSPAALASLGSVAGNRSPRSSEHQASLITRYERPMNNGWTWFVGGDVSYESSRFSQVHNLAETGDRTYVGLRTGIRAENWDVMLWGKNVTDEDAVIDILRYIDTSNGGISFFPNFFIPRGFGLTLPRGRQFGVTASYRF